MYAPRSNTKKRKRVMELTLHRKYRLSGYTIGKLYINGDYYCDTLEDTDRGLTQDMDLETIQQTKVAGVTAIPTGRYRITLKVQSPKYSKKKTYEKIKGYLPRLLEVPGYQGVLIHIGNYPKDTEGCILVGQNTKKGAVMNSTKTFWRLYEILKAADSKGSEIWITIHD